MLKRFFWVGVGLMLTGILTTTIALSQSNDTDPALVPTLTETPTEIVMQPTLEAPTLIPPTEMLVQPTLEPPTVVVELPSPTIDPALLPSATLDPAFLPTSTLDPALLPSATLDPAFLPSATLDPAILPSATLDPAFVAEVTADPLLTAEVTVDPSLLPSATPFPSGSGLSGVVAVPPTQPGLEATIELTAADLATVLAPESTAIAPTLAPMDVVQTAVATVVEATLVPTTDAAVTVAAPTLAAPTATTLATGQVAGVVAFEHLQQHAGIRLTLQQPDGTTTNIVSDDQGRFAFPNLLPGSYALQASAHGFLTIRVDFTLADGQQINVPAGLLQRGDTNEDNVVDLRDVALIAANFNGPAIVTETDLNGDGWIDISDLSLAGSLFGTSGPLTWD